MGTFPNHHPDPSIESNLEELKHAVIESKVTLVLLLMEMEIE